MYSAAVFAEINIALVVDALQQGLYGSLVGRIGGADEAVVLDAEFGPQGLIFAGNAVHEFLRRLPRGGGRLDDFVSVFVRAGKHADLFSGQAVEAFERVGHKGGVRVPQMGAGVDVVDGGGDVVVAHGRLLLRVIPR